MSFGFILLTCMNIAFAQGSSGQSSDQKAWLQSKDPGLAKNKKFVYDFWRDVLEAGHLELADQFLTVTYIQHNPNVPSGRQAFVDFFSKFSKPQPITDSIKSPLIAIVAEGDLVILVFKRELPDPADPAKNYATTGFDMFRIEGGKIAEHWDADTKR